MSQGSRRLLSKKWMLIEGTNMLKKTKAVVKITFFKSIPRYYVTVSLNLLQKYNDLY